MFINRTDAGQQLARAMRGYASESAVILALPRGGVEIAAAMAEELKHPIDAFMSMKLSSPDAPEFAFGALAEDGSVYLDHSSMMALGLSDEDAAEIIESRRTIMMKRIETYRDGRPLPKVEGRTVILVDDGIATGATMRAAVLAMRKSRAARVVVATPVCSVEARQTLRSLADEVTSLQTPLDFGSVGRWYRHFPQLSDQEVTTMLSRHRAKEPESRSVSVRDYRIPVGGGREVDGRLHAPDVMSALVVFAHGSGSGRTSPRNLVVAQAFQRAGFGTLMVDMMMAQEIGDVQRTFDIPFLSARLSAIISWIRTRPEVANAPVCIFGASTGAAAALRVAARDHSIHAVISRGGRVDLAEDALAQVTCPVLLIVGADDEYVLGLNRSSRAAMRCHTDLVIIPGATHLFAEPGALERVASESVSWLLRQTSATETRARAHA